MFPLFAGRALDMLFRTSSADPRYNNDDVIVRTRLARAAASPCLQVATSRSRSA